MNKQGTGKIDWCDYTWNPVSGCLHGCDYCYLDRIKAFDKTPAFHEKRLQEPFKLQEPSKIFVGSSGDLFGDWVKRSWVLAVLKVVQENLQHVFQFLTKNPRRYTEFVFPKNAWLGTSIDTQARAQANLPFLRAAKARLKFVSFEPLLERVQPQLSGMGWVIVGGKSVGRGKFVPPEKEWIDSIVTSARHVGIPVFLKDNAGYAKQLKEFPKEERR